MSKASKKRLLKKLKIVAFVVTILQGVASTIAAIVSIFK